MWLDRDELARLTMETKQSPDWYINCGGHAFGIPLWYQLGTDIHWFNDGLIRCSRNGGWRNFERSCVRRILKDIPGLRVLPVEDILNINVDLDKNEVIAFRISRNWLGSYHFMRCEPNGDWTEKRGHWHHILRHKYEEIFDIWEEYDGRLYFFVRERAG